MFYSALCINIII